MAAYVLDKSLVTRLGWAEMLDPVADSVRHTVIERRRWIGLNILALEPAKTVGFDIRVRTSRRRSALAVRFTHVRLWLVA